MTEMVRCSSGHRFPVNREKHQNRKYVMCPRPGCHERVQIRKRRFSFNLEWPKIKARQKKERLEAKEKKRGQRGRPVPPLWRLGRTVGMSQTLAATLAFSAARKKAEEEKKSD